MSNRRRPKIRPRNTLSCGACGGRIGALAERVELRDGRSICARCRDRGVLSRRLPCGHMGIPGTLVIADSSDLSNFQCVLCSPHAREVAGYAGTR